MPSRPPYLTYIIAKDVMLTRNLVTFLMKFASFRSLRSHCRFLEFSCNGIVWLTSWIAFIWIANNQNLYQMQFNMLLGLLLDIVQIAVIKAAVRRRRPSQIKDTFTLGPDKFSFPSGHASRAFFVLTFFTILYPVSSIWWMPLIAWSCSVALSRLLLKRHYLLDITVGAILGVIEAHFLKFIWISSNLAQNIINFVSEDNLPGGTE